MKKEDKRGRLDRNVDKKISREAFVQNEKNFGDMHKNIHLLAWVRTVTGFVNDDFTSPFFCTSIE
jgi:hypothetical protein